MFVGLSLSLYSSLLALFPSHSLSLTYSSLCLHFVDFSVVFFPLLLSSLHFWHVHFMLLFIHTPTSPLFSPVTYRCLSFPCFLLSLTSLLTSSLPLSLPLSLSVFWRFACWSILASFVPKTYVTFGGCAHRLMLCSIGRLISFYWQLKSMILVYVFYLYVYYLFNYSFIHSIIYLIN